MNYPPLLVTNRMTGTPEEEKVYGEKAIRLLYGGGFLGSTLKFLAGRLPFVSAFYGWLQKLPSSKKKVLPFIKLFKVEAEDFIKAPSAFTSFNDFFIRKLKPSSRPFSSDEALCPADGRYRFFPHLHKSEGFIVKNEKFDLTTLLGDQELASLYTEGSLMMARLCPSDYHRFHFPCDGVPSETKLINGWLYSVNPSALTHDIHIFTKNKRTLTRFKTSHFGEVLLIEVGATNVGSIHQTFVPGKPVSKGDEKGYFEFGASALLYLFEKDRIQFSQDLLDMSEFGLEIKCLMGQSLGRPLS